jgi:hypothetical protein
MRFSVGTGLFLLDAIVSLALFGLWDIRKHLEFAQVGTAAGIWLVLGVMAYLGGAQE